MPTRKSAAQPNEPRSLDTSRGNLAAPPERAGTQADDSAIDCQVKEENMDIGIPLPLLLLAPAVLLAAGTGIAAMVWLLKRRPTSGEAQK